MFFHIFPMFWKLHVDENEISLCKWSGTAMVLRTLQGTLSKEVVAKQQIQSVPVRHGKSYTGFSLVVLR